MNNIEKVIKALVNALMTLILIVGIAFILLYIIGIEPFVVISGSMEPTIETGSLSFINKHVKYSSIKPNDVIAYQTPGGAKVTHRVINVTEDGMETKGDSNNLSDGISTRPDNFIGKNIFSIPKLGYGVKLMQTSVGKIVIVTLAVVILISGFLMDDKKGKRPRLEH